MKNFIKDHWKILLLCALGLYVTSHNPENYGYMGTVSVLVLVFLAVRFLKTTSK
tara:strand:- start:398 stop:559 length:162 start_codon:yes stop_codon:yes gene_type:complete